MKIVYNYEPEMSTFDVIELSLKDQLYVRPEDALEVMVRCMRYSYICALEEIPFNKIIGEFDDKDLH